MELIPLARANEETVAKSLTEKIICQHGVMNQLISDRGSNFVSHVMVEVYKLLKIRKVQTTAWHPQGNGQTERFNQPLADMLAIYCNEYQRDWDQLLPFVKFAYNSSTHETTKFSPYYLLYGQEPRFPFELALGTATYTGTPTQYGNLAADIEAKFNQILGKAKSNTEVAQHKMMLRADKEKTQKEYRIGEKVWLYTKPVTSNVKISLGHTVSLAAKSTLR